MPFPLSNTPCTTRKKCLYVNQTHLSSMHVAPGLSKLWACIGECVWVGGGVLTKENTAHKHIYSQPQESTDSVFDFLYKILNSGQNWCMAGIPEVSVHHEISEVSAI